MYSIILSRLPLGMRNGNPAHKFLTVFPLREIGRMSKGKVCFVQAFMGFEILGLELFVMKDSANGVFVDDFCDGALDFGWDSLTCDQSRVHVQYTLALCEMQGCIGTNGDYSHGDGLRWAISTGVPQF